MKYQLHMRLKKKQNQNQTTATTKILISVNFQTMVMHFSLCKIVTQDPFLIPPSHLAYEFISLDWLYFPQYAMVMELHDVTKRDVAVYSSQETQNLKEKQRLQLPLNGILWISYSSRAKDDLNMS